MKKHNILIIKHGALGDIILAGAAIKSIREYHKKDFIYCLTTEPYTELIKSSPWIDEIIIDIKPKWNNIAGWIDLYTTLKKYNFLRVYDLQTSDRTNLYFYLFFFFRKVKWSGIAAGCYFRHNSKNRTKMHTLKRQKEQLSIADVENTTLPDWRWLITLEKDKFFIEKEYALIIPGTSSHRKNKKWSKECYRNLVDKLSFLNIKSVFIGLKSEKKEIDEILYLNNFNYKIKALNLAGKTKYNDIARLANSASLVVGNDTGPIHLAASCGSKVFVLFGQGSDPNLCAPMGENVVVIQNEEINKITVDDVFKEIQNKLL